MRIIAGKYRHRLIEYPENNPNIRPTKDRIREAVFSAIGDLENKTILDLYAGSGSMGIEAISRGAKKCYFVDHSSEAIKVIQNNISILNINNAHILYKEDTEALNQLNNDKEIIDICFIDPPYCVNDYLEIIEYLVNNILNVYSIIVVESKKKIDYSQFAFSKIKNYNYGEILVDIIWR